MYERYPLPTYIHLLRILVSPPTVHYIYIYIYIGKLQPLANRALNKERVILYKNGRELEAGYFVIEISTYQRYI